MTLTEQAEHLPVWLDSDDAHGPDCQTAIRMNDIRTLLIVICQRLDHEAR